MADISEDLATDDLDSVKFLLSGILPREKVERAKNFLDVIIELEKLDKVSPESVDFVEECLMNISRVDLAKKVKKYKNSVASPGQQSPQLQLCSNPCPVTTPYSSQSPRQTRPGQIIHRVASSAQQSPQQQLFSAPCPATTPYNSQSPHQTRPGQMIHRAPENLCVTAYREQSCQSQVDRYKFNSNPRGVCVIIDCVGNDGDMLEQAFKALHFSVVLHKWLSVDATLAALRETFRHRESLKGDAFICCVISRGTDSHLLGTDSYVVGLSLDSIRRLFTAEACPMLAGKPKLFFIQRYSVPESQPWDRMQHQGDDLETDGLSRGEVIPSGADVFWSHCWTDERLLEQENHRSVYLKSLTDALQRSQRRRTNLLDVHTEMNGAIYDHNRRNPEAKYHFELKHTLRKDLYLH
ncbi:CASP8 and FADD-like apoptosis regulator isoform X2 [Cheilinus undulatus]|nr:CASP8 and FADD-like apoptosis regulator isoform X2 [Cheilinus undulatus]